VILLFAVIVYACFADALDWWPWNDRRYR
jgi:hypothetical protein